VGLSRGRTTPVLTSSGRTTDSVKQVLGLTGSNAAGKGEVATYLRSRGFSVHSLSDVVREEAAARELPPEREHLIRIGNELREAGGPGALARRIVSRLGDKDVVDSIRNPVEVEVLRELPHFVLIGVAAHSETRFRRSIERGRPGDPGTIEEFRQREEQENTTDPNAQQLEATFRLADHVIENDGGLEDLHRAVDRLLLSLDVEASQV
jgi:dephospho-CoA kinase